MKETWRIADLHAYVDECLEPYEREAFEKQMAEDPGLAQNAAQWRAQNGAIRAAFDGEGTRAFSISLIRHQNETVNKPRRGTTAAPSGRTGREEPSRFAPPVAVAVRSRLAVTAWRQRPLSFAAASRLALAGLVIVVACAWPPVAPRAPASALGEAGVAAFRVFVRPDAAPVEVASADAAELQAWLSARLSRPVYLPATPASLSLVGARIAPAPGASAGFLVYRLDDRLIAVLVGALDAPSAIAPRRISVDGRDTVVWTWGGQGFAIAGDVDGPSLLKLANSFFVSGSPL